LAALIGVGDATVIRASDNAMIRPSYLRILESGEFERRASELESMLSPCRVCPRLCGANREGGATGSCRSGRLAVVASAFPHHGEEHCFSGWRGSGTVFLGCCNLKCVFCQNHDISQPPRPLMSGTEMDAQAIADALLALQDHGCHNINFVSPTHFAPQVAGAVLAAARRGLRIPIIYNTNGYDRIEVVRLLEGIVDLWMPDLKYSDAKVALELSGIPDYPGCARRAIAEMHRQVGSGMVLGAGGVAVRGLLIRLLVLPNGLSGTEASLEWIARELGPDVTVNLMAQYHPAHRAAARPAIDRRITRDEYRRAVEAARRLGMRNVLTQALPG